jgi:hypothetical protein
MNLKQTGKSSEDLRERPIFEPGCFVLFAAANQLLTPTQWLPKPATI